MNGTHDLHQLSGAYALDALDPLERARFERHLEDCESCAVEVASFRATLTRVALTAEVEPDPGLRTAVLAEVDRTRQVGPLVPQRRGGRGAQRVLAVAAGVLAAAVVGLTVRTATLSARLDTAEQVAGSVEDVLGARDGVTLTEATTADGGTLRLLAAPSTGTAVLVVEGIAAVDEDLDYQVWLVRDGEPVSAGLLEPDADGGDGLVLADAGRGVAAVALTVEPAGGSPAPTSDPVATLEL